MKVSSLAFIALFLSSFFVVAHLSAQNAYADRACCAYSGDAGNPAKAPCTCYSGDTKTDSAYNSLGEAGECAKDSNGNDLPGCKTCGGSQPIASACGTTDGPSQAKCTQAIYAVPIPANMTIGQNLDFYADAHQDIGNFVKMTATITNVPTSTPAIASVITTSGPTCYSTNNNCRQGFRITAKANGTALLRVTTQMKLCPACAVSGSCTGVRTINIGSVTPLMCKPGAACTSDTASYAVGSKVTCSMPALTTTELAGGVASYQVQCTPLKGTTAQAVIAKSSANGVFASFPIATGVTGVNCSFRYCVTGTNAVTQCSLWGTK